MGEAPQVNVVLSGVEKLTGRERRLLREAVLGALGRSRRRRGELCVVLVDDRGMRSLHKRFMGRDSVTDVLSFPYEAPPGPRIADRPFGDVYIAMGAARRQAKRLGHPLLKEVLTLAVHGTLHLVGYDDRRPSDKRRMFARQDRVVARILGR